MNGKDSDWETLHSGLPNAIEASDAEAVRETYRINNIPFDSVWSAEVFEP